MTRSIPPRSAPAIHARIELRPEHKWISGGNNLDTGPDRLVKRMRDSAEGCRDRASANLLHAVTLLNDSDRKALEENAASWSARAVLLEQREADADPTGAPTLPQLRLPRNAGLRLL